MSVEVSPCASLDELAAALSGIDLYFGIRPTAEDAERFAQWIEVERMHAARDGEAIVGGAGAFSFDVSVPGGARVPCAGVTVVGVLPTHRRRGVLTALMRAQLDDVHRRGEPLAYLWASEATIYGRFGYGVASRMGHMELARDRAQFARPFAPRGEVRLLSGADALAQVPPVYERARSLRPGLVSRSTAWWEMRRLSEKGHTFQKAAPLNVALLSLDREPAGYALYRLQSKFTENHLNNGRLDVVEAVGLSPEAERELWRYLLDVDWVPTIEADYLPIDHPLFLLLAEPRRMLFTLNDGVWVRLVDVEVALVARTYRDGEAVVLEVADGFCNWNAGRYRVSPDGVRRTADEPDLRLDVDALGSVYLGGFTFAELARALRLEEARSGGVERADALFATAVGPWCAEIF